MEKNKIKIDFTLLRQMNPLGFILRENIGKQTGGILNPRTEANADAIGTGCPGRIKIGRRVAYPLNELESYINSKIK